MSFIQKALKVLQEFPNLKNERFEVKDKKKKSFLQEAENFFKNLTSPEKEPEELESDSIDIDLEQVAKDDNYAQTDITNEGNVDLPTLSHEDTEIFSPDTLVSTPIVPTELDEEDSITVDLDLDDSDSELLQEIQSNDVASETKENESFEITSVDDFDELKSEALDEFSRDTETLELEQPALSSVIENLEN